MTEKEFLDTVVLHVSVYFPFKLGRYPSWEETQEMQGGYRERKGSFFADVSPDDIIRVCWKTGGVEGGSWRETSHHRVSGDPEPMFDDLDTVLWEITPQITYFQFKKLIDGLIQTKDFSEDEYYGNSTEYRFKFVKLRDLYQKLKEMELI